MAASLLAGLARIGAGLGRAAATGARGAARSGAKKLVKTKIKSKAKERISGKNNQNKKLSKKSALISSKGDRLEEKLLRSKISEEETTPTLTGTPKKLTIKSASKSESQIEQLKINVTNIHKFLVKSNRDYARIESKNKRLSKRAQSKIKLGREERQLEKERSPFGKSLKNVKDSVASGAGSMFEKVLEFGALLLAGIIVNALPAIIEKVQEIIDNIVNFLTPIQSGFNLIKGFFTGEIDESKYDADKKRFSDGMDNINEQIDKISEKMGPFEGLIEMFKPVVDLLSIGSGGKKIVLAKQDEKEGVLNKETEEFTERQFTAGERKKFEQKRQDAAASSSESVAPSSESVAPSSGVGESSGSSGKYGSLLDFIGSGEGGYNSMNQGTQGNSIVGSTNNASSKLGKNLTDMTIGEIMDRQAYLMNLSNPQISDYGIFAAGKYQIIPGTMPGAVAGAGLSRSDKFTPQNQDKLGMALIMNKRPYVGKYLRGEHNDVQGAMLELAREFASMPDPNTGRSLYGSGNRAFHSVDEVREALIKARNKPQPKIKPAPNNKGDQAKVLNQPDPRKNRRGRTIAVQQVNTIQTAYVPMPIPMKSKSFSSSSSPQLSSIWA